MISTVLVFAICILCTIAQKHVDNFSRTTPYKTFQNRLHPIKSTGAFAEELNKHKEGKEALRKLLVFLNFQSRLSGQKVKSWRYGSRQENPCTPVPRRITQAVNESIYQRGWGEMKRNTCITNHELDLNESTINSLNQFYGALEEIKFNVLAKLKHGLKLKNFENDWNSSYLYSTFRYRDLLQNCSILHLSSFHVLQNQSQDSKGAWIWALSADITNEPPLRPKKDRERQYLSENVYVDSRDEVRALNMAIANSTFVNTSLAVWSNIPGASRFTAPEDLRFNPAVDSAIRKHRRERMQAEDLITSYNVAILLLPLATALIPVASFADVPLRAMLLYLVLTDIVVMCPLLIRGAELLHFARLQQTSAILRFYGALDDQDSGAAQLWYATCNVRNHLLRKGATFIVIALLLMILGVSLELFARRKQNESKLLLELLKGKHSSIGSIITCESYVPCLCHVPVQKMYPRRYRSIFHQAS